MIYTICVEYIHVEQEIKRYNKTIELIEKLLQKYYKRSSTYCS